jgi:type IV pilus assembly protein PilW
MKRVPATWTPSLPAEIAALVPVGDVISIRRAEPSEWSVETHATGTSDLVVDSGAGIATNDILMVSNCEQAAVFQVTNVEGNSIAHGTNLGTRFEETAVSRAGEIHRAASNTYYVVVPTLFRRGVTPGVANPGLIVQVQELVNGVQDMQIEYGIDVTGDRIADNYDTADAITWGVDRVVSARISLLLMSVENNVVDDPMTVFYNGATIDFSDSEHDIDGQPNRRMYQVFTTTIGLRNRLP